MTFNPTEQPLVLSPREGSLVVPEVHTYAASGGPLPFSVYRPHDGARDMPRGVVVFVSGYPDPGMRRMLGKGLAEWASYRDWARLVAEAGLVAITYENHTPDDVYALVGHLRAHAAQLGLQADRVGIWGCSGNGPTALSVLTREKLAASALLYPFLLDLDGDQTLAEAARQMYFAPPTIAFAQIPDVPLLLVRAGADTTPGLDASLGRFLTHAKPRLEQLAVIDHAGAAHAFDLVEDTDASRAVIRRVLAFLGDALGLASCDLRPSCYTSARRPYQIASSKAMRPPCTGGPYLWNARSHPSRSSTRSLPSKAPTTSSEPGSWAGTSS